MERVFDMPIKNDKETYKQVIEMGRNIDYMQAINWIMSIFQYITN